MIEFVNAAIQYDQSRIFRRLRIEPDTYVYEYSNEHFPELVEQVKDNLHMLHCFCILDTPLKLGIPDVDDCEKQVVCLSSCGPEILQAAENLIEQGDFLEGYVLNDLANEILFNGSDQMNRIAESRVEAMGCHLTRRYSPGEGSIPLELQKDLLSCFRNEPALQHVHLTESFMLAPEKSMLYVFGADPKKPKRSVEHDCSQCPNVDCFFRMEGESSYFCE